MTLRVHILVVCGDPGGANALVPVLKALVALGAHATVVTYGASARLVPSGKEMRVVDGTRLTDPDLRDLVRAADILLAGTSGPNSVALELRAVRLARQEGVPSFAFIDFWSNYASRFRMEGETGLILPDELLAVDESMRAGLAITGIDRGRISIVGHPAFDALEGMRVPLDEESALQTRERHGARRGTRLALFCAQPVGTTVNPARQLVPDSDAGLQTENLEIASEILSELGRKHGVDVLLCVRPHPRQPQPDLQFSVKPALTQVVYAHPDAREALRACDVVLGVTTVLLVEATLMRCPAIALRLRWPEGESETLPGFVVRATDRAILRALLESAVFGVGGFPRADIPRQLTDGLATQRVMSLILAAAASRAKMLGAR